MPSLYPFIKFGGYESPDSEDRSSGVSSIGSVRAYQPGMVSVDAVLVFVDGVLENVDAALVLFLLSSRRIVCSGRSPISASSSPLSPGASPGLCAFDSSPPCPSSPGSLPEWLSPRLPPESSCGTPPFEVHFKYIRTYGTNRSPVCFDRSTAGVNDRFPSTSSSLTRLQVSFGSNTELT